MTNRTPLTAERARQLFRYEDGKLYWLIRPRMQSQVGDRAGYLSPRGYRFIRFDGLLYREHRVIFLMFNDRWPLEGLDHINGIRDDNRIENLREANQSQNVAAFHKRIYSRSGYRGVVRHGRGWSAVVGHKGRNYYAGTHDTARDAAVARDAMARKIFGHFAYQNIKGD